MRKITKALLVLATAFTLTACNETLYSNLSEAEANEMLVTLLKRGIAAQKTPGSDGFSIEVPKEDLILSLEIVKEHSLPREQFASLGTVFSGQGMIASQTEEQARLAFAISQELSATFSKIDGVLDARVHVVLVQHEQSSGLTTPPSAAIFIRHTKDSPVTEMISGIKDTAAKAVPGLTLDNVSVLTELFQESALAPRTLEIPWYNKLENILALSGAGLVLLAIAVLLVGKKLGIKLVREKKDEQKAKS